MDDNKIVNLNEVVSRIAVLSDVDEQTSREFMQAFSHVLTDALLNKDSVDIKAIGRFSTDEHQPGLVKFEASLPLASVVNRPFSCFDPVELDDAVEVTAEPAPEKEIITTVAVETPQYAPTEELKAESDEEQATEAAIEDAPVNETQPIEEIVMPESIEKTETVSSDTMPNTSTVIIDDSKPLQVEIVDREGGSRRHPLAGWIFSFGVVIGLCVGFVAGILLYDYIYPAYDQDDSTDATAPDLDKPIFEELSDIVPEINESESQESTSEDTVNNAIAVEESAPAAKTATSTPVVTDTIAPGRYLASMARKYYGSYVFWVYIYEENRDKISDPDNVSVGTVVVIPDASKYGIDALSAESVKKAKARAAELVAGKH